MKRAELDAAVRAGILGPEQADRLAEFLAQGAAETPRFSFVHVLYYLGGMIAIGAMSLFMTLGWATLGGWGGFVTAVGYAILALALTHWFLERKHLEIPAGIMATLAVVMVPLAIFGAQQALGHWGLDKPFRHYHQYIDGRWLMMEFGTLAVAAVLLWRYRFPFMLMPVSITLWYMSMDLGPLLVGSDWQDWDIRKLISLYFGILFVGLAFWVDIRSRHTRKDYAFWLYLFGVITFWGGLSSMQRVGQAHLLPDQRGHDPRRGGARPARVRGVRRTRRGRLPGLPRRARVQGQPAVPVRAVPDRPRHHRARRAVAAARGPVVGAPARVPAQGAARAAGSPRRLSATRT
jgi:hypothetical protein